MRRPVLSSTSRACSEMKAAPLACEAMPELPELEVLREYLGPRLDGKRIAQVWTSPKLSFLLRTPPDEFARQLTGGTFERTWRRGKFLIFDISGQHLVINPMLGGRLQWTSTAEKVAAATVFRITLDGGDELRFLDTVKTGKVLHTAIESIKAQPNYEPHKQDRSFMAVHGKAKEKCPRCGHRISELTARGEATDFCRGCQH